MKFREGFTCLPCGRIESYWGELKLFYVLRRWWIAAFNIIFKMWFIFLKLKISIPFGAASYPAFQDFSVGLWIFEIEKKNNRILLKISEKTKTIPEFSKISLKKYYENKLSIFVTSCPFSIHKISLKKS